MSEPRTSSNTGFEVETTEKTVLLVDDEENILSSLKRLLRRDGYRILTAGSGAEGLEVLSREAVDVIVSDQRMPGMNGTDFLKRAKAGWPQTVRIVLSGYTDLGSVTEAINDGAAYKFLTKPWDDEILRLAIREAFAYKWVQDENRMLHKMMVEINAELSEANRRLAEQTTLVTDALAITQDMLHFLPIPVLGVNHDGILVLANAAALELLCMRERPRIGHPVALALPPELATALHDEDAQGPQALKFLGRDWSLHRTRLPGPERGEVIALIACKRS